MSVGFVLAPQAALDLVEIWRYIKEQTSLTIADRVESAIREKIVFSREAPEPVTVGGIWGAPI
jgi:plasmid stabilization system protein ParE